MALIITLDVLVVAIFCFLALSKKLEGALPLAAFLLILFPSRSQISVPGFFGLTTQRVLIIFLFILYMLPGIGPTREQRKQSVPLKYLIIIEIVWMLLSSANSAVPVISFKAVLSQMLDYFLPFYIFCKTITSTDTIKRILYAMVLATGVASVFGVVEAYSGWRIVSLFPALPQRFEYSGGEVSARGVRVFSTFPHPILFGTALAIAIPIAVYLLSIEKMTKRRVILWSVLLLMFVNIYKTGSRGAWLALVVALGLMGLFGSPRMRKYLLVIALLTVTVLTVRSGVWSTLVSLYYGTRDSNTALGTSYQWRYALYSMAVRELGRSVPRAIWGYGPSSFFYLGLVGEFQGRIVPFQSCDSSIAEQLIETGYVGFLITALLLLTPALSAFRSWSRAPRDERRLCVVFLTSMAAYYFMMTNVACYGWGQQDYFLWVSIAFAMVYPRLVAGERVAEHGEVPSFPEFQNTASSRWARRLDGAGLP